MLTLKRTGTEISDVESTAVDDLLKIAEMNSAKKPKVKRKKMKLDESGIVKDTKGTHKRFDNGGDGDVESNNDFDGRYDDVQVAVSSDDETQVCYSQMLDVYRLLFLPFDSRFLVSNIPCGSNHICRREISSQESKQSLKHRMYWTVTGRKSE